MYFSFICLLSVSPEGSVRVSPPLINAQVNTSVLSTCTAEGGPNNTFTWSVDTERGRKGVVQEGPVLMTEVDVEDGGLYCCHVENAAGYDEAYLTINGMYFTNQVGMNCEYFVHFPHCSCSSYS